MSATISVRVLTRPARYVDTIDASVCSACALYVDLPAIVAGPDRDIVMRGMADLARRLGAAEIVVTETTPDARALDRYDCVICGHNARLLTVEVDVYV